MQWWPIICPGTSGFFFLENHADVHAHYSWSKCRTIANCIPLRKVGEDGTAFIFLMSDSADKTIRVPHAKFVLLFLLHGTLIKTPNLALTNRKKTFNELLSSFPRKLIICARSWWFRWDFNVNLSHGHRPCTCEVPFWNWFAAFHFVIIRFAIVLLCRCDAHTFWSVAFSPGALLAV